MIHNTRISMIAAIGKNHELGKNNKIPWHIPEDSRWFHEKTAGHAVIMGRKTFESIGHPLANRINIIVTRDLTKSGLARLIFSSSLDAAIEKAKKMERDEIFIIGGGQIYEQGIKFADRLYLTIIEGEFEADTFFPNYQDFKKVIFEKPGESKGYKYKFLILERTT